MKTLVNCFLWSVAFTLAAGVTCADTRSSPQPALPQTKATAEKKHSASDTGYGPTVPNVIAAPAKAPSGMVWIAGGEFTMGLADPRDSACGGHEAMDDARPLHRVYVDPFWIDATEVTNAQFERFVRATGYVTVAERKPSPEDYPDAPEENLVAGSIVFAPTAQPVPLDNHYQWWAFVPGANWRHPTGPESSISGKDNYPVVQIAYDDAVAYSKWAGKRLPTEAEWEYAARGGLSGKLYPWGDDLKPKNTWWANIFQGDFPLWDGDSGEDGYKGAAPVAKFRANNFGLFDVAGNVWEWCSDWYRVDYYRSLAAQGGVAKNPQGPDSSLDPDEPNEKKRVQRGGSFLCTDKYCSRYMVGSRGKGEVSTASNHLGFRCVQDAVKTSL